MLLLFFLPFFTDKQIFRFISLVVPLTAKPEAGTALSAKYFKVSEFVKLSPQEFSKLTGKKLNVFQKLSFQLMKLKMKHDLKRNPDMLITDYKKAPGRGSGFNIMWFLLGIAGPILGLFMPYLALFLLFSFLPVIIAYTTHQNKESIKSVWMGFGVGMLLILLLIVLIIVAISSRKI
ncbi:MAG: hypothetical protein KGM16_03285 [Bacteroidota bacterium]|nr:hypothetical protein [Bacteroidota bacterium]